MSKTLSTDMELLAAALSQVKVTVVQRTADDIPVIDNAGTIEKYTDLSVKVIGVHYVRTETEFRVEKVG